MKRIRQILSVFKYTPLHPQWFAFLYERERRSFVVKTAFGRTLDVGCGRKIPESEFQKGVEYIGLDYDWGAKALYDYSPDCLADAHNLPIRSASVDSVLLLEVIEHLSTPGAAVKEAFRVLKPGGVLILSAPFLYPLHDEPHDYQRWTLYGLHSLVSEQKANVQNTNMSSGGIKTVALLYGIAVSKSILEALAARHYIRAGLRALLALVSVPLFNIVAWLAACGQVRTSFMPIGVTMVYQKSSSDAEALKAAQ